MTAAARWLVPCVLALGACRARHAPEWSVVDAAVVRRDWRTLPVVATVGTPRELAVHPRFMTDADTDESAPFGPFELRWTETGYHSAPREWVAPRVCDRAAGCVDVWRGSGGVYRRVIALRHDAATDTWVVSVGDAPATETLGVAFRRSR